MTLLNPLFLLTSRKSIFGKIAILSYFWLFFELFVKLHKKMTSDKNIKGHFLCSCSYKFSASKLFCLMSQAKKFAPFYAKVYCPRTTVNSKYVDPVIQDSMLPAICIDQSEPWHKPFREYLLRIIDLDEKKPDFYELDITICLQSMWRLLLEHITYEPQASRENSLEYDRIKKILSYIEENYQNKITLNDIAGHIHLCESECTRLFKRHMNTTLFAFLQEYRIERSLEFLQDDQPVSAVADKAGFSDPNYYSKVFAKIKGCSPREYRNHRF